MVTSRSHHAFFCGTTQAGGGKMPTHLLKCRLFCSFHFFTFKMAAYEADSECSNE